MGRILVHREGYPQCLLIDISPRICIFLFCILVYTCISVFGFGFVLYFGYEMNKHMEYDNDILNKTPCGDKNGSEMVNNLIYRFITISNINTPYRSWWPLIILIDKTCDGKSHLAYMMRSITRLAGLYFKILNTYSFFILLIGRELAELIRLVTCVSQYTLVTWRHCDVLRAWDQKHARQHILCPGIF